jgi:hypothetical protein
MTFRADLAGAGRLAGAGTPGEIDYRLARHQLLSEWRKGRLARHEVCDAHPELVRAARNVGEATDQACPVCEQVNVVLVSYVFGPRMPPQGRCVTTKAEMTRLRRGAAELACYVVEVCPSCSWNHLARTFLVRPIKPRRPKTSPAT